MNALVHIRNETNELRLLFEICQTLRAAGDINKQLESIIQFMVDHTAMVWGGISFSNNGAPVHVKSGLWLSSPLVEFDEKHPVLVHRESLEELVLKTGLPGMIHTRKDTPETLHRNSLRHAVKEDIALFCVPLIDNGSIFGTIFADRLFADSVTAEEDVRLLSIIASLIAHALAIREEFETRHSAMIKENRRLQALLQRQFLPYGIVGNSAVLQAVLAELTLVATSNATVLLLGESGTGKELAASAIHGNSPRAEGPFVRLNCAAIPEGLVESELFGHERGAFTGATGMRKGRFEMAHGGTLFLDEVGDLSPLTQAKLLRILQEKEFERVGGSQTIRVDVRLIAATNRDLEQMVQEGSYRQDLYYRLSVFPIQLPPLRKRCEDIMPLATHFAEKYGAENNREIRRISTEATRLLTSYSWPGNIRELENVMERAVILCGTLGVIEATHLPPALQGAEGGSDASISAAGSLGEAVATLERHMITGALQESRGNMVKAAQRLGITERTMGLRMRKYTLCFKDFRHKNQEEGHET